ncbi:phospholipase C/P1 nuclease [Lepidopterella palustris CBS 459.81]|uniref:Phospholipase C/P1 nuclease n=1 Tax=Lepidopterella palustris CBS 459.81 TaxID=1314670 RepID=A0A8E2EA98_9PEZI|nr:phospholipase C/P1 nuclease [Lepidopterella palustris CBS 459.81]
MMLLLFVLYIILPLSSAWGNLAHRTIALLAQKHFTPSASLYTSSLLKSESLSSASIWADTYKFLPEGRHTSSWHFVDARDAPPHSCNLSYARDCHSNRTCIIAAIVNMTSRVNDERLEDRERTMALKFLLHLIGDLHCPLHAEGLMRGGNDISVLWGGRDTNLHFVWDVLIPQSWTNSSEADENAAAVAWAERLYNMTLVDPYLRGWTVQGPANTVDEVLDLRDNAEELVVRWASEANAWVCRTVLRDGVDGVEGKELSGKYYIEAIPSLEELVSKAGWRLAAWINELARKGALELNGKEQGELKRLRK